MTKQKSTKKDSAVIPVPSLRKSAKAKKSRKLFTKNSKTVAKPAKNTAKAAPKSAVKSSAKGDKKTKAPRLPFNLRLEKFVDTLSLAIFAMIFLLGVYAIADVHLMDLEARVDEELKALAPVGNDAPNFTELRAINKEIVAWLRLDGTNIDYPVLKGSNNSKYLTRNYREEKSVTGSIFVDFRNDLTTDNLSVLYGHRTSGNQMFSDVSRYSDSKYFNQHRGGKLFLDGQNYSLKVVAYAKVTISKTRLYNIELNKFADANTIMTLLREASEDVIEYPTTGTKFLLLSTCDKDTRHYRDVIIVEASAD